MSKFDIKGLIDNLAASAQKHSPEILVGLGLAGMVGGTVGGIMITPKAMEAIENEKKTNDISGKLPLKALIKATWKYYLPIAAIELISGACIIGSSSINHKRNAALMTAYTISETARKEYAQKVIETVGENKERAIRDAVAKDTVQKHPVQEQSPVITGNGNTLCFDPLTARYFKSDIESIRRAVNVFNKRLLEEDYLSLNDFYDEIGLPEATVGNFLGWNASGGLVEVYFSSQLATNGTPCLVVAFSRIPKVGFDR